MNNRMRTVALLLGIVGAFSLFLSPASGATDADYASVTARIVARIGALDVRVPGVNWAEEIKKAVVHADGSGGFSVQHGVEWVLDRPAEKPGKLNGRRAVIKPGGFWIQLTFFRGEWKGAAVFRSTDFGDLHVWYQSEHKDAAHVIAAVAKAIEEEHRAFEQRPAR